MINVYPTGFQNETCFYNSSVSVASQWLELKYDAINQKFAFEGNFGSAPDGTHPITITFSNTVHSAVLEFSVIVDS